MLGLRDYLHKCGFKSAVLGLSGGIDSALVACLAVAALGAENVHGVSLPSQFSSQGSLDDARILAESLGIRYEVIPIQPPFASVRQQLQPVFAAGGGHHGGKYSGAVARRHSDGAVKQIRFAAC